MLRHRMSIICLINDLTREKVLFSHCSCSLYPRQRIWGPRGMGAPTRESGRRKRGKTPHNSLQHFSFERPMAEMSELTFSVDKSMSSANVLAAFSGLVTKSEEVRFGSGGFRR